jgi:hypothetical protein
LASRAESGAAARATGELGEAPAGLVSKAPPTDERKKRRLIPIALTDNLLDNFGILSTFGQFACYLGVAKSQGPKNTESGNTSHRGVYNCEFLPQCEVLFLTKTVA